MFRKIKEDIRECIKSPNDDITFETHSRDENSLVNDIKSNSIEPTITTLDEISEVDYKSQQKHLVPINEFKYQTLSRMRTFEVDGQVITTRTTRIIDIHNADPTTGSFEDSESKKLKDLRKTQARELKQLQRAEQKDCLILIDHIRQERENKDILHSQEKYELGKRFYLYYIL